MAVTKTEDGVEFPAEAYAYVPDPEKPSTWKLRLWEDPEKKETPRQVGMAVAALSPGGFRGNRVEIPREDLPAVKKRVLAAWKKVHPDAEPEDVPPVLRDVMESLNQLEQFVEYVTSKHLGLRVNRESGVIYGVKVLGLHSRNGRVYSPAAVQAATKLYEGKPVNVDHAIGRPRSYRDRIGKLVNVRFDQDGLYADLLVNPKHPLAEQLFWDAEHAPENVGLSHDIRGKSRYDGTTTVVETIEEVRSVDLVPEPATTRGLFEGTATSTFPTTGDAAQVPPATGSPNPGDLPPAATQSPPTAHGDSQAQDDADDDVDLDRLPDEAFAIVLPGGVRIRDRTFPLTKRWFPIHSPAWVKRSIDAILSNKRLSAEHRKQALERAKEAARKFGIEVPNVSEGVNVGTDLSQLTVEELRAKRPDLVSQIVEAEVANLQAELARLKRRELIREKLKSNVSELPQPLLEILEDVNCPDSRVEAVLAEFNRMRSRPTTSGVGTDKPSLDARVRNWRAN
jgi:tetrahydromethanopterin S-methyltransferase subunit G